MSEVKLRVDSGDPDQVTGDDAVNFSGDSDHLSLCVQAQDFRIYSQEVLEFGEKVSFLLLLPPSDEVCTAPGQNNPYSPRSGFLTLPLQIFELGQ